MRKSTAREFLSAAVRNRTFMIGFVIVLSVILFAIFADQIAPYPYDEAHRESRLAKPGGVYLLGTDDFGRDMLSRIIYGSRITLQVAGVGTSIMLVLGVLFGLAAGFFGKAVDHVLMFIADITWCVPGMILALMVITLIGKGLINSIIAMSLVSWAHYARTVRAKTLALRSMAFIETGIAFGEKAPALMFRYILPNILPVLIVMVSSGLPALIISTTALSFLGLGAQPPSPDWGLALNEGVNYLTRAPWLSLYPGLALMYTVFGFNLLGEGLRDLLDTRLKVL